MVNQEKIIIRFKEQLAHVTSDQNLVYLKHIVKFNHYLELNIVKNISC